MTTDNAEKEWADAVARSIVCLKTERIVAVVQVARLEIERRRKLLDDVVPR